MAMAFGSMLIMTGCADADAPTGDALYRSAEKAYLPFAEDLHALLMGVHAGDWAVDQGQHGALPISCQRGADDFGYSFHAARSATLSESDPDAVVEAARDAFEDLGIDAAVSTFGEGEAEERNIIGTGGSLGRAAVTFKPATGSIRVSAQTACFAGSAFDVGVLVFGDDANDSALRLPAFEGPASVPQFYFPADGPVYYSPDGTPILPQPVVTDPPEAPYEEVPSS
ncbi:MAG TPA: hypothetical protein VN241_05845 [Microbacterium sp.]|nr:hypothetical protein [Microbacterium sp.]